MSSRPARPRREDHRDWVDDRRKATRNLNRAEPRQAKVHSLCREQCGGRYCPGTGPRTPIVAGSPASRHSSDDRSCQNVLSLTDARSSSTSPGSPVRSSIGSISTSRCRPCPMLISRREGVSPQRPSARGSEPGALGRWRREAAHLASAHPGVHAHSRAGQARALTLARGLASKRR